MLYNKNWDKPVKRKTRSLASVIAWLETKNPSEYYRYRDWETCLAAQYHEAMGTKYRFPYSLATPFGRKIEDIARHCSTFGEALMVAKAMQKT